MALFRPKPWVNPFGKMSICRLLELVVSIAYKGAFSFYWFFSFSGFGPKMAIFPTLFLRNYRPGKCFLRYSRTIRMFFQAIKARSSRIRIIHIFPQGLTHGFCPKIAMFPCVLGGGGGVIYALKMSFTIFQNEKDAFLGYKNKKLKKPKN